ncbi:prolipoprotein diacylglyceryl transferase [Allitabrizicola rongguiensis]|uniref:prolipoprotein diacylglyceryl transferase n=1 Tax=Alitabrizicola rongguiensis TaxID=2909234 RepID=UPI0021037CF6|nr:prolipoprotein diacylglyceryl transferase family protein [Tabrizicola rongguiensis]
MAAAFAVALMLAVSRWRLRGVARTSEDFGLPYMAALAAGAILGGFGFGTLNLWVSGIPGLGRSILGALAGAILAVEIYKARAGIRGSTGLVFVAGFSASVAVGRIGCFLSGIGDNTHGTLTALPWGHDFGDGLLRHPVQLYESLSMALFLAFFLWALWRRVPFVMANGFYLMVGWYGFQRFLWEFLKPYAPVAGPLNIFQFLCLALMFYALFMIRRSRHVRA